MSDSTFILSFEHDGKQYDLKSKFLRTGYVHQFHVELDGSVMILEFDKEQNYRVMNTAQHDNTINDCLLKAMVNKISELHA